VTLGDRRVVVPTAEAMRDLGSDVGRACAGGDVILLSGELGAGKTTFTQGVARGLGIREAVTSPTFVIARTHQNPADGPDLVHVDAYRLGSAVELDDLDLDADLATSVVVVEWGGGLAERLSAGRLDVDIMRSDDESDEARVVILRPHETRWADLLADDSRWSA
jgi:tRNA threonylcarbamoyladenosine biosynthesis protein TsaE